MPICKQCNQSFEYKNYIATECCSRSCAAKLRHSMKPKLESETHKEVKCAVCNTVFITDINSVKQTCSNDCRTIHRTNTRRLLYPNGDPSGSIEAINKRKSTMIERYNGKTTRESAELQSKIQSTMIERYGAKTTLESVELKDKVKQSMIEQYGVDNPLKSEEIKQRQQQTNIERYGFSNPMQNQSIAKKTSITRIEKYGQGIPEIMDKCRKTWLATLGVDNPSKSPIIIQKIDETFQSRYGVKRALHVPEFKEKQMQTNIEKYGVPWFVMSEDYQNEGNIISKLNRLFGEQLQNAGIPYKHEHRIETSSYDFHIIDTNILLELNPSYTHNAIGNHWNHNGLDHNYHLNKTLLASQNGYRCIHIWDWDDTSMIIDMIKPKVKLYGRDMEIWKLDVKATNQFLMYNHLQGPCKGQILCLGLVKDNEIYMVMTFGKSRYDKSHSIELLRLCTKRGYTIVGGANKLSTFASKTYELDNIISYCDRAKFNGDIYERIGMKLLRETEPQEVWSKVNSKITANLLRQRGFDQLFGTTYGKGASNDELMIQHGWLPVFDCGQSVWSYRN